MPRIKANVGSFRSRMQEIFHTYRDGQAVIILSEKKLILHGEEELEDCIATGIEFVAKVFFGINEQEWLSTDCPALCEAARLAYFKKSESVKLRRKTLALADLDTLFSDSPNPRQLK